MLDQNIKNILKGMLSLKDDKNIPPELLRRCERVVDLIQSVSDIRESYLRSIQIIAIIVEQWERDNKPNIYSKSPYTPRSPNK